MKLEELFVQDLNKLEKQVDRKELYLLRHGDTGFTGRYIGVTDVPMSQQGENEVRQTARSLSNIDVEKVICSPMLRCRQTLDLMPVSCQVSYSPLVKEIDFGRWEKKSFSEVVKEDQKLVDSWVADYLTFSFPEGESIQHFIERLTRFKNMLSELPDQRVLVITHGGVIRHLLCLLLDLTNVNYLSFDVKTGRYCSLDLFGQGGALTGFNLGCR